MKVLILYAKVGNGHLKASEAIRDEIKNKYPDYSVYFEDGLAYSGALTNKMIIKGYANLVKYMPGTYGKMYYSSDTKERSMIDEAYKIVNRYLTIRLKKMIRNTEPDVIISTHPFITRMCSYLKRKKKTPARLMTILTDYGVHNMWVDNSEYIDKICVATSEIKEDCIEEYGLKQDKVEVTGIPCSDKFLKPMNKEEILNELGLKDTTTFLFFAGGGLGLGDSEDILEDMLKSKKDFQLIVVSGKNEKQKQRFEKMVQGYDRKVVVLGYTDRVPELMNIATAVITKPGGLTSTECLVMRKPMLIINPIPGQEEQNAVYFSNNGTALIINEATKLSHVIEIIVNKPKRVEQMREMCNDLRKPNAAAQIASIAKRLAENS